MPNNFFHFCLLLPIAIGLSSCTQEIEYTREIPKNTNAIIVNEGQFGYATSSLSLLSEGGEVVHDLFRGINNRPLGDVAQSITQIGDNYYVPLNNSAKVEVFNCETFESVETMPVPSSAIPMYLTHLGGDSAVVTNQKFNSSIMILDLNHNKQRDIVRRSIYIGQRSFQMKVVANKLFVGGDRLLVFDLGNITEKGMRVIHNKANESLRMCDFSKVVTDYQDRVWVLTQGALYCIDPLTEKVVHQIDVSQLAINDWVSCIDTNKEGTRIYINSQTRVYCYDAENPVPTTEPLIAPEMEDKAWTIYGMFVSPYETIMFANVRYGSLKRGIILEYNRQGELVQDFKVGIFPHYIHFLD